MRCVSVRPPPGSSGRGACVLLPPPTSSGEPSQDLRPPHATSTPQKAAPVGLQFHTWARMCGGKTHPIPGLPTLYPGVARPRPLSQSSPGPGSGTFSLAGVVRLHEVPSTAAEVATLGVVAELRAGAEAQALVDVWGLHGRVMEKPHVAGVLPGPAGAAFLPWHPGWPGTVWKPERQAQ